MVSFKNFRLNSSRKAVLFCLSDDSQQQMSDWAITHGFDLTSKFDGSYQKPEDFDFHITVICSTNEVYVQNTCKTIPPLEVKLAQFDLLGKEHDVPVICTEISPEMQAHRALYTQLYGLHDKWPEWKTHISLSYNYHKNPDLSSLPLPEFPVIIDKIKITDYK